VNPYLDEERTVHQPNQGNCVAFDDDFMFPDRAKLSLKKYQEANEDAKAVCEDCPIKISCLGGALRRGEEFGIWGGTTPEDRKGLLSGLRILAKEQAA
jgi:WhiB family redox-sensing transcriptional regulator